MTPNELDFLEIVSCAGAARNAYVEAIAEAKAKNYDRCNILIAEANELYAKSHRIHSELVQNEAGGDKVELSLLLTHAQDILMSADSFKILCDEFVDLYRRIDDLERH